MHLTGSQIVGLCRSAGWTGENLITAVQVILGESGGNTLAVHVNSDGSVDRGLWQINSHFHPEVAPSVAFDQYASTAAAFRIWQAGGWKQWHGRGDRAKAAALVARYPDAVAFAADPAILFVLWAMFARYNRHK